MLRFPFSLFGGGSIASAITRALIGETVVRGTVPAGATATLRRNGTVLGAATVSPQGAASYTLSSPLVAGDQVSFPWTLVGESPSMFASTSATASKAVKGIVFEGDSITFGFGTSNPATKAYGAVFSQQSGLPFNNQASSGDTLSAINAAYAANNAPLFNANTLNTFSIVAGVNDVNGSGATDAQLVSWLTDLCAKARATGFVVIVGTMTPVNTARGWNSTKESYRTAYNTWLRQNYQNIADYMIDYAAMAEVQDPNSTVYYLDGLHPSGLMHVLMGTLLRRTLGIAALPKNYIRLTTLNALTETLNVDGGYEYTPTSPSYTTGFGVSSVALPAGADGWVAVELAVAGRTGLLAGLRESATNGDYTGFKIGLYFDDGYTALVNGGNGGALENAFTGGTGDVVRIRRTAGVLYVEASNDGGQTFTILKTSNANSTGKLWVSMQSANANCPIKRPYTSSNFV